MANSNVKVTQKDYFNGLIAYLKGEGDARFSNEEYIEFLEGRIAVLDKKSANRKTKVNEADEELKDAVIETLTALGEPSTVSALMKANERLGAESNQKISAILRKLIADEKVLRDKDKKTTLFSLV
jgi:hypothetical protein